MMNERIRELYNKASVYAYEQNPGENSYGRPVDENKYEEDRYTKFAELIVRQMLEITDAHTEVFQTDRDRAVIEHIKQSVKTHFGVEE
jgi:hypothetical protein